MPAPGKLASLFHDESCPEHDQFEAELKIDDIQGDIITPFPKRAEDFVFFEFKDARAFKKEVMPELYEKVSHAKSIMECRQKIQAYKLESAGQESLERLPARFFNIAFSSTGLKALGLEFSNGPNDDNSSKYTGNRLFNNGQEAHATALGDRKEDWRPEFKASQSIHGVLLIAAESDCGVEEHHEVIWNIVGRQAKILFTIKGRARPDQHQHDEHFGWRDGISNPFIKGLHHECQKAPGQRTVQPETIILKTESDTVPAWAINGSFMVFRELDQLVPEFHQFMEENPVQLNRLDFPNLTDEELKRRAVELRAAQFVGRWPSGAPLEVHPLEDNQGTAQDPKLVNKFVFQLADQSRCPFSAHIRKMNPRLSPDDVPGKINFDNNSIVRAGITYGPELCHVENQEKKTEHHRGLAFVCYQANIDEGFRVQQMQWANNPRFPPNNNGFEPTKGLDPLIGHPAEGQARETADTKGVMVVLRAFVTSRGGEYFFVPSMTMLKKLHTEA